MNNLAFLDTEIDPKSGRILDIGCLKGDGSQFHRNSIAEFIPFISGSTYVCGHNILHHDIKYIGRTLYDAGVTAVIDTLFLSPLIHLPQSLLLRSYPQYLL